MNLSVIKTEKSKIAVSESCENKIYTFVDKENNDIRICFPAPSDEGANKKLKAYMENDYDRFELFLISCKPEIVSTKEQRGLAERAIIYALKRGDDLHSGSINDFINKFLEKEFPNGK